MKLPHTILKGDSKTMSEKIVQLNEELIKGQIKELVRGSVEETLNELLDAEAEKLTQAARYERNEARQGYRSGHYDRSHHYLRRRHPSRPTPERDFL
jgi:transposase-like protein